MRRVLITGFIVLAGAALSACGAKGTPDTGAVKPYSEMTEAEQQATIDQYAQTVNLSLRKQKGLTGGEYHGSAGQDMMYFEITNPVAIPENKMREVKAILAKTFAGNKDCSTPAVAEFNKAGIGFQTVVKDTAGAVLYKSEICPAS